MLLFLAEPRPEHPSIVSSAQVTVENDVSALSSEGTATLGIGTTGGGGGGGGSSGGSNMVARDDTAAMHRLIAQWLQGEAERLAGIATEAGIGLAERDRTVRALFHALGVLAVFFRCVSVGARESESERERGTLCASAPHVFAGFEQRGFAARGVFDGCMQ